MIIKKYILSTLNNLDTSFKNALLSANPQDSVYFSKLAILEYCGWIEEALDTIVRRSVKGKLKTTVFRQMFETSVIENTHGFQYKKHFRSMMTRAVGLQEMEKVEKCLIDAGQLEIFIGELETVKSHRDNAAHTWINGATRIYPSPSYTRSRLLTIYPILKLLYSEVSNLTSVR